MLGIVVILIVVAVIAAIEVPLMWRKKLIKEMWVFSFLLLLGTFFSLINALHISVSNPLGWMIFIYKPVSDMVNAWLS
ncbi:hypothetical protein BSK49_02635 [Paenibacillus odorifer]|uniref:Uncharacterized protein n=1 Tax=Paenibacillus odorifer TaxID=189426 RepID=A0ABX3GMT5_9BACL|nr:hypothetical protein BK121_28175 [Paenibacillus odorifer]OMC77073.1 hypothetical protein BK125_15300 [Paenibacillus odorifer]OMD33646.1 hypothetical protein BSO21_14935 [Paenibacillus odorifer]OMD56236.1 hypothetical protein BSK55_23165 [Paenibacillus odorifer]OMD60510.1 hypothetical protein BSK62_25525 [Paenibacillus odorifer]